MARFKLKTDAYRDGRYYRAGEVMVCEGDQKPPKGSIKLPDVEPAAEDLPPELPVDPKDKKGKGGSTPL